MKNQHMWSERGFTYVMISCTNFTQTMAISTHNTVAFISLTLVKIGNPCFFQNYFRFSTEIYCNSNCLLFLLCNNFYENMNYQDTCRNVFYIQAKDTFVWLMQNILYIKHHIVCRYILQTLQDRFLVLGQKWKSDKALPPVKWSVFL